MENAAPPCRGTNHTVCCQTAVTVDNNPDNFHVTSSLDQIHHRYAAFTLDASENRRPEESCAVNPYKSIQQHCVLCQHTILRIPYSTTLVSQQHCIDLYTSKRSRRGAGSGVPPSGRCHANIRCLSRLLLWWWYIRVHMFWGGIKQPLNSVEASMQGKTRDIPHTGTGLIHGANHRREAFAPWSSCESCAFS